MWEAVAKGLFGLLDTVLAFGLMAFFLWAFMRGGSKLFGGWGQRSGNLFFLDPRRILCKHRVADWGPGKNGLWAFWCDSCGKKVPKR